jgi:rubredoxin
MFFYEGKMQKYICISCGYIYDPEKGDPMADIPPGTPFEELPNDWCCPMCYVSKENFDPVD